MPQSLRATIGRKTTDPFFTLRHWNLRNLTLQQECYLTSTQDFFRNTHGSITLPPRQPRVFARLGSLAINLEKWQITEYWKNRLNNLDLLPIQNLRQYHFHDVAKYEKISPKESVDIKEFRLKWRICLPVIRWDVTMVTALIQKLTTKI